MKFGIAKYLILAGVFVCLAIWMFISGGVLVIMIAMNHEVFIKGTSVQLLPEMGLFMVFCSYACMIAASYLGKRYNELKMKSSVAYYNGFLSGNRGAMVMSPLIDVMMRPMSTSAPQKIRAYRAGYVDGYIEMLVIRGEHH